MAQFDVYENEEPTSRNEIPYLLDVQNAIHAGLSTRVIVPLVITSSPKEKVDKLCPQFQVLGQRVMMSTPEIGSYPVGDLRHSVASLRDHRTEIITAIDFLLSGF